MSYLIGVTAFPEEDGNELRIDVGTQVIVTCESKTGNEERLQFTFEIDDFKDILNHAIKVIELAEILDEDSWMKKISLANPE